MVSRCKDVLEKWLGVKSEETEKLNSHPKRGYNGMEILGGNTVAAPWMEFSCCAWNFFQDDSLHGGIVCQFFPLSWDLRALLTILPLFPAATESSMWKQSPWSHMYVTCREPLSSSPCPGCHVELSQGTDHLFVRKAPSLSVYLCDCYCCCCCAFPIPLLFAFNKLWSQAKVCFCSSLARGGRGKGVPYLEFNFWMGFKPLHG